MIPDQIGCSVPKSFPNAHASLNDCIRPRDETVVVVAACAVGAGGVLEAVQQTSVSRSHIV